MNSSFPARSVLARSLFGRSALPTRPQIAMVAVGCLGSLSVAGWLAAADAASSTDSAASPLPVTEVVLYSSGVGYFERQGEVKGRTTVDLRFKVDDINDLLKSMVVQDLSGGQVTTVSYGSRDPIQKTLKTFAIDLTENPSMGTLLNQARGERVEVQSPAKASGTIVGVEKRKVAATDGKAAFEEEFLNLLLDEGLVSIPLTQVRSVALLNPRLNQEFRKALETLASGHDTQKKTVSITFDGQGARKAMVAYVAQTSVWKTSYRLVLDERDAFLQGWAIVENTTDEDWRQVKLSMVSGRPVSFSMDLYRPIYVTRPVVQPEVRLVLGPQVYSDAMEERAAGGAAMMAMAAPDAMVAPASLAAPAPVMKTMRAGVAEPARYGLTPRTAMSSAPSAAAGASVGELFQYAIKAPVTLARQQSAMIPIVGEKIQAERVSIFDETVHPKHPMNGLRLKNTTALHLMQGPVTVFDSGAYAGDARIEDLAPGQDRLISYALDAKVEVEALDWTNAELETARSIRKGTMVITRKMTREKTYRARNRDVKPRAVLIEHPFLGDWVLADTRNPDERTRDRYRFRVLTAPGKTESLRVREERPLVTEVHLSNIGLDEITTMIRTVKVSAKFREAVEKVSALRVRNQQTTAERERKEQRVAEITKEQSRIRENMARLAQNSELYTRYVKTLDRQETELETLRQQIEPLKDTERAQEAEFNTFLLGLDVE